MDGSFNLLAISSKSFQEIFAFGSTIAEK